MTKPIRRWRPTTSRTLRGVVEERLEAGEPIEAWVPQALSGIDPESRAAAAVHGAAVATFAGAASAHSRRSTAIAVTDRRVFLVNGPASHQVNAQPMHAVRVLEYDTRGTWLVLWLNVDGLQHGFRVPKRSRAAVDALVDALGGAPPSLTRHADQ